MQHTANFDCTDYITTITLCTGLINQRLEKRDDMIQSLYQKTVKRLIRVKRNRLRLASCRCRQEASKLLRQCSLLQPFNQAAEIAVIRQEAEFLLNQAFDFEFEACRLDMALE